MAKSKWLDEVKDLHNTLQQYQKTHQLKQPSTILNCQMKAHQIQGLEWFVSLYKSSVNGILGDDMGLGKTLQSIAFMAHLKEFEKVDGPFLIVCPLTIVDNWISEFAKFCPSFKTVKYIGKKEDRELFQDQVFEHLQSLSKADLDDPPLFFNVVVTSYDILLADQDFLSRFKWRVVFIDEGHRLKNNESVLYTTLKDSFLMPHCFLLTGTPVHNNLGELWALLHFIMPDKFDDQDQFESWFSDEEDLSELHDAMRPFLLRRHKSEVLKDLPPKKEYILYTKLSKMQKKYYKGLLMKDKEALGEKNKKALTHIVTNLRKCCNHPYLFDGAEPEPYEEGEHLVNNSGKMILLDKLLKKLKLEGHRVLIFSQMTTMLDILQDYLHYRKYSYERLDGSVRGEERFSAINRFSTKETFVFLLSTRAGGVGLNLTCADTVIFIDSDWNPQMDLQAQERVYRIGQTKEVSVFRLITEHTIEDIMLKRAFKKLKLSVNVVEKGGFSSLDTDDSDTSKKTMSIGEMIDFIKYGLHKVIDAEKNEDDEERELLNMDIEKLLAKGDSMSFEQVTQQSLESSDNMYEYEGKNYKEKKEPKRKAKTKAVTKRKTKKSKKKSKKAEEEEESSETEDDEDDYVPDDEDAEVFEKLIAKSKEDDNKQQEDDEEEVRGKRTINLRKRKIAVGASDDEDDEDLQQALKRSRHDNYKRTKRSENYRSMAIVIDDLSFESEDKLAERTPIGDEEANFDMEDMKQQLTCVIGDVTHPHAGDDDSPKLIINCVSDYGKWSRGGLFSALDKVSSLPRENYEQAAENDDLQAGDAHLVPIKDNIFVVNLVAQKYDTKNSSHGGIRLKDLETALHKVAFAAKKLHASVHCPRIGFGLENFNWYGVERVIKKCLVSKGITCFVYYYKRGQQSVPTNTRPTFGKQKSEGAKAPAASASTTTTPVDDESEAAAFFQNSNISTVASKVPISKPQSRASPKTLSDVFDDMILCLYNCEDRTLRGSIQMQGGTLKDINNSKLHVIVTELSTMDKVLHERVKKDKEVKIVTRQWLEESLKNGSIAKYEKYQVKPLTEPAQPNGEEADDQSTDEELDPLVPSHASMEY